MAHSPKRASSSAATIWSRRKTSTRRSRSRREFQAHATVRSRSARSGFTTEIARDWTAQFMTPNEIGKIVDDEAGRALATLIRLVGDFDLAEDALQDAFAVALERWPQEGTPSNPRAWLVNVGRNKVIDRIR